MLVYLGTPYSHPDPKVREARFQKVNKVAAKLMASGFHVFSPISHSHPIALAGDLPISWDYWSEYDRIMLSCCEMLVVLELEGWEESTGLTAEIRIARELGIHIVYMKETE